MKADNEDRKMIRSTQTAFDIVEVIAERERPSITEIADAVECSRSTVHYHLNTLQQSRYVIRDENGLRLGLRMARLGNLALRNHRLTGVVERTTNELARETGAIAHVAVKEGNKLAWLHQSTDDTSEGENRSELHTLGMGVGEETSLHCTAYGQAILAHLSSETVEAVVTETGLPALTQNTLTTPDALDERLSMIRQLGFAYSPEEFQNGLSSIAAPVFDESDGVVGAIGITDSHGRIDDPYKHAKARRFSDELPGQVQKAARIASNHVSELST